MTGAGSLPRPRTAAGRLGLAALLGEPARALIAMDFDGTLSPIVHSPDAARAHPGVGPALGRLAPVIGTLAVITGRPADVAVELGGFAGIPGLIVLGHYGSERWQDGVLTSRPPPPGVAAARAELPRVLAEAKAPAGTLIEDKGNAVAVHTRRAADPQTAIEALRGPLTGLATRNGLTVQPGRLVLELRPDGIDKGVALGALVAERHPASVLFCGDDLGDVAAFDAVRALRGSGIPGLAVCSGSAEAAGELAALADLVVDGPEGISALLSALADSAAG
ncbi:MAG TPA: trehalose-phosphatase [Streptosporangiaceae bacterium]|nr:trehalose-phosphatase [Streptosporangiaceae bacterium]